LKTGLEKRAGKGAGPLGEGPGGSDRDEMGEKEIAKSLEGECAYFSRFSQ